MVLFFYLFAALLILGAFMVILSNNPVYSVLWLIFTFCNGAGLMVLISAEFIAMILIIIYVGAIAVLFLFVIMMLDIKYEILNSKNITNKKIVLLISVLLFVDLITLSLVKIKPINQIENSQLEINEKITNVYTIGKLLYTDFILPFQTIGICLLVSMIATITLTHRLRSGVKKQNTFFQKERNKNNSLILSKVEQKTGVNNLDYDT